jgi:hypothetical protein
MSVFQKTLLDKVRKNGQGEEKLDASLSQNLQISSSEDFLDRLFFLWIILNSQSKKEVTLHDRNTTKIKKNKLL